MGEKIKIVKIKSTTGVPFNVVIHKSEKALIVTFYDSQYVKGFSEYGQKVSDYYASTLLEASISMGSLDGLNLYGNEPDWIIAGSELKKVIREILDII